MTIRMVMVLLINLYVSRLLLDALGIEDYGIYNVVAGFVSMFTFLNSSLSNGIQRFYNYELGKIGEEGANKVFNVAILIQAFLVVILVLPTEIIGIWYLHNKMVIPIERMYAAEWIFQLAIITFIIHIMQVPFNAAVMAHERMNAYAVINVLHALLTLILVLLLPIIHGDLLILYGVIISVVALIQLLCYVWYCKKNFSEVYFKKKSVDRKMIKEMASFSGWNVFGTLGHMLKDQGVNLILNLFFGPVVNAARAIAYQVNSGLQSFVSNITIPVRPQVVQSYAQGNYQRAYSLTFTISKLSCFALLMMAIPVLLEINYILHIWLGENIPNGTSVFIVIVVLNSFILNLNSAISGVVHATGKMKIYQLSGGAISIVSVILVYVIVSILKIPEVAFIVILILDIIRQIIALYILRDIDNQRLSIADYGKSVILPFATVSILSIIIPYVFHVFLKEGFFRLIIVTFSAFVSIGVCTFFCGLTKSERATIQQIISKIVRK